MIVLQAENLESLIEYFFVTLRSMSQQMSHPPSVIRENSKEMLAQIVTQILTSDETPERQMILINRINQRFMGVLVDYDRPWVWQLLRGLSAECPAEYLN